ncbi:MAG: ferritin [Chloroflexota bacterium]|nr:ferritin [Chloroflexota bacterium]
MLDEALQEAINRQINLEFYAAYTYLSMAAHFESVNLLGFAHWMARQSREEQEHAMRFYNYVHERNSRVTLLPINQPPVDFGTPLEVFQMALEHEQKVTRAIHDLYELARQENDYPTQVMLQWFIEEQVEEEKNAEEVIAQLQMIGEDKAALFLLDRALGERGFEDDD